MSADGPVSSASVSDSSGVAIVENREGRWGSGGGWSVSEQPRVSIGVLDGAAEYQLFGVSAAALQSDGTIVMVDGSRRVRRYDPSGEFIDEFGGAGSGPGEFRDPEYLLIGPGDSIEVGDVTLSRVTRFGPAGELAGTRTLDLSSLSKAIEPPRYPGWARPLPGGGMLVNIAEKAGGPNVAALRKSAPDVVEGVSRPRSGAVVVAPDLMTIESRLAFAGPEESPLPASAGSFPVQPAQGKQTVIAVHPTERTVCVGEQAAPEVTCYSPEGAQTSVRWAAELGPITPSEVERWIDETTGSWQGKMSDDEARKLLLEVVHASSRPAYDGLVLDHDGNLWVEQNPPDADPWGPGHYLVFDPAGALLGELELPPLEILEIGRDYVLGVFRDALGVEFLRVHSLEKPAG